MARSRVRVSFACNDRYGNVTDRVAALALDEEDVRLSGEDRPLTFRDGRSTGEGWVKFSRRTFTCYGAASMVGNVFWEGADMEQGEARRLVVYLIERGWHVDDGPCEGPFADVFDVAEGKGGVVADPHSYARWTNDYGWSFMVQRVMVAGYGERWKAIGESPAHVAFVGEQHYPSILAAMNALAAWEGDGLLGVPSGCAPLPAAGAATGEEGVATGVATRSDDGATD